MNRLLVVAVSCLLLAGGFPLPEAHAQTVPPTDPVTPEAPLEEVQNIEPEPVEDEEAQLPAETVEEPVPPVVVPEPVPPPPPIEITLSVYSQTDTILDSTVLVSACERSPSDPSMRVTGFCALQQSGVPVEWSWYGDDAFINTVGGVPNDHATGAYWGWFSDLTYGSTALNAHELEDGESIVITLSRFPLRITVPEEPVRVGVPVTLSVLQFGFDAQFNPAWEPAAESTIDILGQTYSADAQGTVSYVPQAEGNVAITARKEGYLNAPQLSMRVVASSETTGGSSTPTTPKEPEPETLDPKAAAVAFLRAYQNEDGSFANPLLTDWAAIALASADTSTRSLRDVLTAGSRSLETATDFERRAMALEAIGAKPHHAIIGILDEYDGTQVGDPYLINDDVFALIALSHAGYRDEDPIIQNVTAFLVREQDQNGGWIGVDVTAAAVQALERRTALPGVDTALARARGYLLARQQEQGCFGNTFSTSWGAMALLSLGEQERADAAVTCLVSLQSADGGFESGASIDNRVWATAYALPALYGKTWNELLKDFPKPVEQPETSEQEEKKLVAPEPEAVTDAPEAPEIIPALAMQTEGIVLGIETRAALLPETVAHSEPAPVIEQELAPTHAVNESLPKATVLERIVALLSTIATVIRSFLGW